MTKDEVVALMRSSNSEQEWNDNCDKVKKACDGYPDFWYLTIVASNLVGEVANKWGGDGKIKISFY